MELAPLFLLLLLPPPDATGDMALALEASLRSELGGVAMATAPDRLVTPAMLEGTNPPYRARFVAHVTWSNRDEATVEVRSGGARGAPYRASRVLTFSPQDRKTERGRSIGLVMAGLLRDSPPALLASVTPPPAQAPPPAAQERGLVLGAMFEAQRAKAGTLATGPKLLYDLALGRSLGLQVSGRALMANGFSTLGATAGARWSFIHSKGSRHALSLGLGAVVFRETLSGTGEDGGGASQPQWNWGAEASLTGHLTLWRSLRLVGQVDLQAAARTTSAVYGDDDNVRRITFSRWRPTFGLGLAYAL